MISGNLDGGTRSYRGQTNTGVRSIDSIQLLLPLMSRPKTPAPADTSVAAAVTLSTDTSVAAAVALSMTTFDSAKKARLAQLTRAKKGNAKAWARENPELEAERLRLSLMSQLAKTPTATAGMLSFVFFH